VEALMTQPLGGPQVIALPELGPSLGRVASPVIDAPGSSGVWREIREVRLGLACRLFEAGHSAREALATGDYRQAALRLGRRTWAEAWAEAVTDTGAVVADAINKRLEDAARTARLPRRRARAVRVTESEGHALTARLAGGAGRLVAALDELDAISQAIEPGSVAAWRDAVLRVARRLEDAWLALEAHVAEELRRWDQEVDRVRAWRRPAWPLWLLTAAVLALATYIGLILGGYVRVPEPVRPLVDWWWARW
jgi:hypothetical protein